MSENTMPPVQELAAAIRAVLTPPPAAGTNGKAARTDLIEARADNIAGLLQPLADAPDIDDLDDDVRVTALVIRDALTEHPVSYHVAEGLDGAGETRRPPSLACKHCTRQIDRTYGRWQHGDSGHEQCDQDDWAGESAEPADDPDAREFAADLVGRRVGVTLHGGSYLAGVLVGSADWVLTVRGADPRHPDWCRDVRVETVRQLQPLGERNGDGSSERGGDDE